MALTKKDCGWSWIVLVASFGEHVITGYCQYACGMIYIALLERYKTSLLTTTWIVALFLALVSFEGNPLWNIFCLKTFHLVYCV